METSEAIVALSSQVDVAGKLPDSEIEQWRERSEMLLRLALGPTHPLLAKFKTVRYSPAVWGSSTDLSAYRRSGVRSASTIIKTAIDELRISGGGRQSRPFLSDMDLMAPTERAAALERAARALSQSENVSGSPATKKTGRDIESDAEREQDSRALGGRERIPSNGIPVVSSRTDNDATGVFIVHGHDVGLKFSVERVVRLLTGIEPTILHLKPNDGQVLIQKFERYAKQANYAIVLLTADDLGRAKASQEDRPRGRQNVVFEFGYFVGSLGRDRVAVLCEAGVEKPSDVNGLVYVDIDSGGAWNTALAKELASAGVAVNWAALANV